MSDSLTIFGTDYTGVTGIKAKGTGNGTLTYVRPTGTKSITANGTGIDVASYASVDVAVEDGLDLPTFTITMDENDNVTSVTCSKTFAECKALGFYSNAYAVVTGADDGFVGQLYSGNNRNLEYVFYAGGIPAMGLVYHSNGTIQSKESAASVASLTVIDNGSYTSGFDKVWNSVTVNVPTPTPSLQTKTATPTEQQQTVSPDNGYDGLSSVTVNAIPSTYVGSGVTQRDSSDLTASGATVTVPAGHYAQQASKAIETGSVAAPTITVDSETGEISASARINAAGYLALNTTRSSTAQLDTQEDLTITPTTSPQIAVTAGKYTTGTVVVAAMPSGTAGTPTATKGTVSDHAISVTPSVTNSAGYIAGGTKNGTAVSVSASELVSGTKAITGAGTTDVTEYASASVASGGATASATKGSVSNHSVTVTPKVTRTAGWVSAGSSNGTAVTVSASELVSGSQTITENGTVDVTNLASVTVALDFVEYHVSTSAPTSSQGSDGDIWLVTA